MNTQRNRPFTRIAIVNRGEPAMRLIRAVRQWNNQRNEHIKTIALYTDPDRDALYVREADGSHCLGTPMFMDEADLDEHGQPRRKSRYLDYRALREALVRTRSDAAWVGWGFVSEHAAFAELCEELGVVFIGPPPDAMRRLGAKIDSKLLAEAAGVPVAPWSGGPVNSIEEAHAHAERIGYPLLVKATAGGGGRGIRFVNTKDQLADAFTSATSEARKSFGDGTVFLESRVDAARHVEVQILADVHGTVWPVGVRDCSAQRSNQKVIEEAPSPVLNPEQEQALKNAAVRLAQAAGYHNAGTVEFLFEPQTGRSYFMEMNTRLQVEHPVTEATTGMDLVGMQLAIARGEALEAQPPRTQGHAIEVRLCAEDPDRGFAPAPGRVVSFRPALGAGVRTDSGIREGDRIPVEFDSMVAKVIAYGSTREEARTRLIGALQESLIVVDGGTTNRAFLLRLLKHPDFVQSTFDTKWIDRLMQGGEAQPGPDAYAALIATAINLHQRQLGEEELNFFASAARGRPSMPAQKRRPIELRYRGNTYEFRVCTLEPGVFRLQIDGNDLDVRMEHDGSYEARLCYDTPQGVIRHRVVSVPAGLDHLVEVDGVSYRISRDAGGLMRAPAPGLVFGVHVEEGASVKAGDRLLGLEAMKMEMPVTAPYNGRVRKVLVNQGVQVAAGDPLIVLEPEAQSSEVVQTEARVDFPRTESVGQVDATRAFRRTLRELRRLMLGFDITDERVGELLKRFEEAHPQPQAAQAEQDSVLPPPPDVDAVGDLLSLYLDVETLFSKQYSEDSSALPGASHEQCLHMYLREFRAEGRGLPEGFLNALRAALVRYGVNSLVESPRLRDTLVWLQRSHQNVARKNRVLLSLLHSCLDKPAWREHAAMPRFRALLDRLVALTQDAHPAVSEAAQYARYELFEGRDLHQRRQDAFTRVDAALERLHKDPESSERTGLMAEILSTPYALAEHLAPMLGDADDAKRTLVLKIMARRFYRSEQLTEHCTLQVGGRIQVLARREDRTSNECALATWTTAAELEAAVLSLWQTAEQFPADASAVVDIYVDASENADEDAQAKWLHSNVAILGDNSRISRVSIILVQKDRSVRYFTFSRQDGQWGEDAMLRGLHPTTGKRLELKRMRNFIVRRVATGEDVYLFHARARDNERDERFWAVAEVRDVRAVRDTRGRLLELPEMEHTVLEALNAIREQQALRDARRKLYWNRVTVFVRYPILATRDELMRIGTRLHAATDGLGLEKLALRVFLQEDTSQIPRDTVVSFSDRTGHRLDMVVSEPHDEPLRTLDDYTLKVVRARQRKTTYVYEIVKMLAPKEPTADFPAGRFEEYDLGHNGDSNRLVPVTGRPYGYNSANVVVGVIQSFTDKYPEGITRVLVLGDATREMGALAEQECKRIIAAIDLAQRMGVPLEWFPVSSGAKIAMDSGTENLDWTAAVLKRIIEFTQDGGEINVVVDGINVGAQSYWNAEATMLMHCRGCLIMTPRGSMLLTGKRALDYSGGVSAEDNLGIGGFERIMGPNGQAQYHAHDLDEACRILMRYYDHTYVAPGDKHPRWHPTTDLKHRNVCLSPYRAAEGGFEKVGDLWSDEQNPGRKKPFDIRTLMRAVVDVDCDPLERWGSLHEAEVAVVWDSHLGGWPVCLIGIESKPLTRLGYVPSDGPDSWSGGTLFPLGSKKVARALNAASGNRPAVVVANLSGFDGSPESLRRLQLEYGAEIGRAVVNFKGPLVFCVVVRYHGGAYVVFSKRLNPSMKVLALEGSYASVIGGAPAAAVVFPEEARALTQKDPRVVEMERRLKSAPHPRTQLQHDYDELVAKVHAEKLREVADRFDAIHSVERAQRVGSLDAIINPDTLRPALIDAIEQGLADERVLRLVTRPLLVAEA